MDDMGVQMHFAALLLRSHRNSVPGTSLPDHEDRGSPSVSLCDRCHESALSLSRIQGIPG